MAVIPNKLDRIRAISAQMPILNQEAQDRVMSGQAMQLQNLAKQAPTLSTRQIQTAAPVVAAQQGQQQLALKAQEQQAQAALAGQALQSQGVEAKQALEAKAQAEQTALASRGIEQAQTLSREDEASKNKLTDAEIASNNRLSEYGIQVDNDLSFMSNKQRSDLANLGRDTKAKLFDARLQFDSDEQGRKFANQLQLMDATIASAKNKHDLGVKLTTMQRDATRDIQLMDAALKKITTALERGYLDNKRKLDQNSQLQLVQMKAAMEREIVRKQNRARNTGLVIGAVMTAAGAALIATPAGAPLMAAGLGTAAASQQ